MFWTSKMGNMIWWVLLWTTCNTMRRCLFMQLQVPISKHIVMTCFCLTTMSDWKCQHVIILSVHAYRCGCVGGSPASKSPHVQPRLTNAQLCSASLRTCLISWISRSAKLLSSQSPVPERCNRRTCMSPALHTAGTVADKHSVPTKHVSTTCTCCHSSSIHYNPPLVVWTIL